MRLPFLEAGGVASILPQLTSRRMVAAVAAVVAMAVTAAVWPDSEALWLNEERCDNRLISGWLRAANHYPLMVNIRR